ncbi:acetyltransferase [Gorillibacterium sp. sgz5001074]|uniref:acetyltransferase n=1 Tax=Gorillibacterium sp. sgz5001074 TaxID=3446695 RepID=UPI003F67BA0B
MLSNIIPYNDHYHDELVDLWYQAVVHTHTFLSEQDIQFYHQIMQSGVMREVEIWIELGTEGQPVGFMGLNGTKIEMLFVKPEEHGRGIGRRLIQHAIKRKGRNLQVDVNEQNEAAFAFYKRLGFVQMGRSELDSSGQPFPLLHLEVTSNQKLGLLDDGI